MSKLYSSIIKAGLIAGTLDICAAMLSVYIRTGKGPEVIFRYIAQGAFGDAAKTGGTEYIIAGILFHYLIAFGFTILFFLAYPKIRKWLSPYYIIAGLAYGIVVWCIMNLIVVPSSNIGMGTFTITSVTREMLILMCCIGLPAAILSKKHYQ
jgi:uncharacterized membrane protein YagU involved in acid resistance